MAFNPVLQSQIQPEQTPVQPDSTSFAAGALGTVLNIGSGILQGQQKQQAAEQKALVNEAVSSEAIGLADLFSNASGSNKIRIQQSLSERVVKMRESGMSESMIASAIQEANKISGTSFSAAVKLERNEAAEQMDAQEKFMKDYLAVSSWIPNTYLNDDGSLPTSGPEMEAAFMAALAAKGRNEADIARANRTSAVSNANINVIQERSRVVSEGLSTQITNLVGQQIKDYDLSTPEGKQGAIQALAAFRVDLPKKINSVGDMTRSDKDALLGGMGTLLTSLEDNITGETLRGISAKQTAAWLQVGKDIALSENKGLLQAYIYSGLGLQVQATDFLNLESNTLDKIMSANPNSKNVGSVVPDKNKTPEERTSIARDTWAKLRTPIKPVDDPELADMYSQDWASVFAAPLPLEQAELFGPNGMFLKSLDIFRDKKTADNYGVQVLGNPDFLQQFTAANGQAISTYIPVVMNQIEGYNVKVKEQVQLSAKTGPVQFRLDIPQRLSPNPMSVTDTFKNPSYSAINKLNTILKKQYEAAVQVDRVSGSNLAEQIRNAQLRTASLFIQVDAN
jgi:hypothetical protein